MEHFIIKNIGIYNSEPIAINEHISMKKHLENDRWSVVTLTGEPNVWESNAILFYQALRLGVPNVNPYVLGFIDALTPLVEILCSYNKSIINYYTAKDDQINTYDSSTILNEQDISRLIKMHKIVIEFNKQAKNMRTIGSYEPTRWTYAYNKYIESFQGGSLEACIMHLISGLEALLSNSPGELTYKVSLYSSLIATDNFEQRKQVFKLVKSMYNIRSKAVHGDVKQVIKELNKKGVFERFLELRILLSNILEITYGESEETIFDKLEVIPLTGKGFNE